ncbi:MAG: hypothetical protein ACE5F6_19845 [Anaerolineae bacterium]
MTCISPPALSNAQLLAYVAGEADSSVAAHIEQCPHCREQAGHLARVQHRLTARLFRVACPPPEDLGEYHLALLPQEQAAAVTRHLAICPRCAQEVAQLEVYLRELAPALEFSRLERIEERVRVLVARLLQAGEGREGGQPLLAPAPAGIRGEEAGPYIYQADGVQVVLDVQADAEQPDRQVILGLVTGLDDPQELAVSVWQAGEHRETTPVDELGNFVVAGLTPATYELIVSGPEVEIHIQDVEVEAGQ